jgi:hypothetical protein
MEYMEQGIKITYIQKIAYWLLQIKQGVYFPINILSSNPENFIEACKLASESYYIDITFTPDYSKVKREHIWNSNVTE